jgi:uncharacterized protein with HEPN domain
VPFRDWQLRVRDILNAIASIQQLTAGISFEEFADNQMVAKAVLYDFVVIGEAAINIPTEVQAKYPDIPWRLMSDMRNVIAHEYFQVNLRIVWNTTQNNLPPLVALLEALLWRKGNRKNEARNVF